jgi:hypothetical protein
MTPDPDFQRRARRTLLIIGSIIGTVLLVTWGAQIMIWLR